MRALANGVVVVTAVLLGSQCQGPTDLFNDPRVQQAYGAAKALGISCGWGCATPQADGKCFNDDFKLTLDVLGRWEFTNCKAVLATTGKKDDPCAGEVTYKQLGPSQLEQTNLGPVSAGSGSVTFASDCTNCVALKDRGTKEGVSITQHNSARGAGCAQEVTNLMALTRPIGGASWDACILTVIQSASPASCMPADWWKISVTKMVR